MKEKISAFQFFIMLFLSRALTTVTYISSYTKEIRLSDVLVQPVFRISIGIALMLPVYFIYKRNRDKNVLDLVRQRSPQASKILSFAYVFTFFCFTVTTVGRLDLFAGTVVFPETDVDYMLVFVILLCCYGAYLGFEVLGRGSVIFSALVVPAIAFILVAVSSKVDLLNLTPILYNGVKPVFSTAIDSIGQTVEYSILAIAVPKVSGNVKKGFFILLGLQSLFVATIFFFITTVMGNYAYTQLFPVHTLASLAEFAMFDRLDAVFTGVWIMCAFIKGSLLIYLQVDILKKEFPRLNCKIAFTVIGVLAIIINLIIAGGVDRFMAVDSSVIKIILTGVTAFIIPLSVLIFTRKGSRKCDAEQ